MQQWDNLARKRKQLITWWVNGILICFVLMVGITHCILVLPWTLVLQGTLQTVCAENEKDCDWLWVGQQVKWYNDTYVIHWTLADISQVWYDLRQWITSSYRKDERSMVAFAAQHKQTWKCRQIFSNLLHTSATECQHWNMHLFNKQSI